MFRLPWFLFVAGGLAVGGGTAAGVVIGLHSGAPTQEVADRATSSTPTAPALTTAEALPAPADGYAWYTSPAHRFGGNTYYRFSFQYPANWIDVNPGAAAVGGRSTGVRFGPRIQSDAIIAPPQQLTVGVAPEPWPLELDGAFPMPTTEPCSPIPAGEEATAVRSWHTYTFTCLVENIDEWKRSLPAIAVRGYVADTYADDLFVRITAFQPTDEPDVKAVAERAMSSFILLAVIQPVPKASPPPVPTPPSLPLPTQGYAWYFTPPDRRYGLPQYALQVPGDFSQPKGPYAGNPVSFTREDGQPNWPYQAVPQLITQGALVGSGFEHPFLWSIGRQGGGGCSGDMAAAGVYPSSQYVGDAHTWDVYFFTCYVENVNSPPGVTYDARVAETVAGPYTLSIVAIESPDSGALEAAFQQAMASFRLLTPLPTPAPPTEGAPPRSAPASGYTWHAKQLRPFGLPDYALQVPASWAPRGPEFNPQRFDAGYALPDLSVYVMPASVDNSFPQLLEDCAQLAPPSTFVGGDVTWDVYHFGCDSSSDQSTGQLSEFRAAEARVGGYILSVVAQEPPGSNAAKAAFEKALVSFTLR